MIKGTDFHKRLKKFIAKTGLSNNKFAEKAQISAPQLHTMINSENNFGIDKLFKIFNAFPELNQEWLLKGEGSMLVNEKEKQKKAASSLEMPKVVTIDSEGKNNIVQIDAQAAAGFPSNYDNPKYFEELPAFHLPLPQFQNGTFVSMQASGDSMHPTIYHHDWLVAEFLSDPATNIKDGYVHVVVTTDGVVVKRLLNRIEKRNKIVLQSDNDQYPAYEEDISNVLQVYKVVAKLSYILRNENSDMRKDMDELKADMLAIRNSLRK
jgi:phage repressor protein C with HTH and peptisase S24 domain